ncbi:glycosyltransferase [Mangrovibacterium marinum]|uniref:Cellulose synthase/poly-beta-1,6-N-acetylglucosamine synthase-like glycosyltransferase n=1 Tax=Mangrovibacterium marinum TaxID=1639118 RepID=A0A2T5BXT1_9BACT|nr:glycosyltransferase [Mangrovibacterium marinum]PTN05958.1 cellulose synthase/poly-beta-1,6-N-acetylglucosamine synthase-like glycosyltransferase [Mangrovibacterium marinum]
MLKNILLQLFDFYQYLIFIYCLVLFGIYLMLILSSRAAISKYKRESLTVDKDILLRSYLSPGISVIAPAYNEGVTIISNVRSLLTLSYPRFEVIIVNDGSKDDTLNKLIAEFKLIKTDYACQQELSTFPVRGYYKSVDRAYQKLLVIDKENGKTKADAVNAGLNAARFPYFLNTDVDCILDSDTLLELIQPFITSHKRVIAVGATLKMANSCEFDAGMLVRAKPPKKLLPRFQEIEYIRSFVTGKMGWSYLNAVPNVSGGLGLFDREVALKAGGYDRHSFGEDMEIIIRMSQYMLDNKLEYIIKYIPVTLCWTEGPESLKILTRQRVRWARGLLQIIAQYRKILFRPKYKKLGMLVLPYSFLFELLAAFIEVGGIFIYIFLIYTDRIDWPFAIILLLFVYFFSIALTTLSLVWNQIIFKQYKWHEVLYLCFTALWEPIIYHPLVLFASLKGYLFQLTGRQHSWGNMQRKGFVQKPATSKT